MTSSHPDADVALALSNRLRAARVDQRRADHTLALLLLEMSDRRLYRALGYASVAEFAAQVLDLPRRATLDLIRIGRNLPDLPRLDAALAAGELDWTKAREIVRVATDETEEAWIERAKSVSSRVLERQIAAACAGEGPPDDTAPPRDPQRVRVVFTMEAQDRDVVRDALAMQRAKSGLDATEIEDGELLAALVRTAMAEMERETPPTGERYSVVIEHCPDCGRNETPTAEVSDTVAAEAACDGEVVEMRPGPRRGHATRTIPPALRRVVLCRARGRCEVPGCDNRLWVDVHHTISWSSGGTHDPRFLVALCQAHHRAVHNGSLGVEIIDERVVVTHGDGTRRVGPKRAHVGRVPVKRGEAGAAAAVASGVASGKEGGSA